LGEHPAIAYTIAAALDSGVFSAVVASTDSALYAEIATHYGAEVPFLRPDALAGDLSPDIEWVDFTLRRLKDMGRDYDYFSILRPTSPFRTPATIRRAWDEFRAESGVDSLRAVELCKQHPGKMWVVRGRRMMPLMPLSPADRPWHSCQYQALPEVYVQNASLEIARSKVVLDQKTIAGNVVIPFLTDGYEGFDLNHPRDWSDAEELLASGVADLPKVRVAPYQFKEE
jgi:N-acylneuraminate cytidylyltransferase